ncbi:Uncharacterised protein [Halioglobus japonicus]|nr:Uncharacterised protein [Halioglobus japonicus]
MLRLAADGRDLIIDIIRCGIDGSRAIGRSPSFMISSECNELDASLAPRVTLVDSIKVCVLTGKLMLRLIDSMRFSGAH